MSLRRVLQISCTEGPVIIGNLTTPDDPTVKCLYPSYWSHFGVLVLIAACLPAQLSHLVKVILLVLITVVHCLLNILVIAPTLDSEEFINHRDFSKYVLAQ